MVQFNLIVATSYPEFKRKIMRAIASPGESRLRIQMIPASSSCFDWDFGRAFPLLEIFY
ncbi:arogenate dehydratase/prephenate dehydratase 1, chloroplastic-like [Iris pallida]|uniref:Arogenate dehydratase/prephenate dehydratase 1, chloroplastic-like n=1 Tax=Iris pallida TaxID=29817 RepID=A0AAX6I6A6_IRIPA|nr:arogenate dehydratase/prephenate dehydratase 1, chloroplastic-like [Iris pallida]KAJ6847985.1 arogenate dehydratase/prephenate dehydratase 1, chloroplastic-like [Iris pallida]